MLDYYLKFSTEQEAFQAFQEAGYTSQDEEGREFVISATHDYCVDLVGTITEEKIFLSVRLWKFMSYDYS